MRKTILTFFLSLIAASAIADEHDAERAAIDAVVEVKLNQLAEFLTDLVREGEWPLRKAAWEALDKLGQTKPLRLRQTYTAACEKRLETLETELYAETVTNRMEKLNRELATTTALITHILEEAGR